MGYCEYRNHRQSDEYHLLNVLFSLKLPFRFAPLSPFITRAAMVATTRLDAPDAPDAPSPQVGPAWPGSGPWTSPKVLHSTPERHSPGRSRLGHAVVPGPSPRSTRRACIVPSMGSRQIPWGKLIEHDRLSRRNGITLAFIRPTPHARIDLTSR